MSDSVSARTLTISVDWVTLVTIVVVVSVATFVCTVVGKCCIDKINEKDLSNRQRHNCNRCSASLRRPNHVAFEMASMNNPSNSNNNNFSHNHHYYKRNDSNRQLQRGGHQQPQESGTFGRLGIGRSGSGRNILLPMARQLENQQLSPIQQTPPKNRMNRQRTSSSSPGQLRHSDRLGHSFRSYHGIQGLPEFDFDANFQKQPHFITPSPATTATLRKQRKNSNGDNDVFDEDSISKVGLFHANSMRAPDNALQRESQFNDNNINNRSQTLNRSRMSTASLAVPNFRYITEAEETTETETENKQVEQERAEREPLLSQDKKKISKKGDPGSTIPTPLGAKPKFKARLVFTDTDGQESSDEDSGSIIISSDGSFAGYDLKTCAHCLNQHRCLKVRTRSCPAKTAEIPLKKKRHSVRQVKKNSSKKKREKSERKKHTYVNIADENLDIFTDTFNSMFKIKPKKKKNEKKMFQFESEVYFSEDYSNFLPSYENPSNNSTWLEIFSDPSNKPSSANTGLSWDSYDIHNRKYDSGSDSVVQRVPESFVFIPPPIDDPRIAFDFENEQF